jgi:8-oxo-dGTP diphosphatase
VSHTAVTVELVVLQVHQGVLQAQAFRRSEEPYAHLWSLPRRRLGAAEDLGEAATHALSASLRVDPGTAHVEQLGSYGDPGRDPRGRVVAVAYLVLLAPRGWGAGAAAGSSLGAGSPAGSPAESVSRSTSGSVPVEELLDGRRLAFDHARILADGVERVRAKLEYTPLAAALCPAEFTVAELRRVYEVVWGEVLDPRNFHRKVTGTPGFLQPVGSTTTRQGGRPAQLYRAGAAVLLNPPMLRQASG